MAQDQSTLTKFWQVQTRISSRKQKGHLVQTAVSVRVFSLQNIHVSVDKSLISQKQIFRDKLNRVKCTKHCFKYIFCETQTLTRFGVIRTRMVFSACCLSKHTLCPRGFTESACKPQTLIRLFYTIHASRNTHTHKHTDRRDTGFLLFSSSGTHIPLSCAAV